MRFNLLHACLALFIAGAASAKVPSVFEYRLGDHIIDYPLSELDVIRPDLDGFGGQSFIKVRAANATEVVLTFRQPQNTLQYLEHDWIERDRSAPTALGLPSTSEFTFGQTRVSEIQVALGQQGFHYACRQLQPISGGLLTFVSFEIPSRRDAVYTFVAEYSRDLADRGLADIENIDLTQSVLVGTIVSRPDYPDDWEQSSAPKFNEAPARLRPYLQNALALYRRQTLDRNGYWLYLAAHPTFLWQWISRQSVWRTIMPEQLGSFSFHRRS